MDSDVYWDDDGSLVIDTEILTLRCEVLDVDDRVHRTGSHPSDEIVYLALLSALSALGVKHLND